MPRQPDSAKTPAGEDDCATRCTVERTHSGVCCSRRSTETLSWSAGAAEDRTGRDGTARKVQRCESVGACPRGAMGRTFSGAGLLTALLVALVLLQECVDMVQARRTGGGEWTLRRPLL